MMAVTKLVARRELVSRQVEGLDERIKQLEMGKAKFEAYMNQASADHREDGEDGMAGMASIEIVPLPLALASALVVLRATSTTPIETIMVLNHPNLDIFSRIPHTQPKWVNRALKIIPKPHIGAIAEIGAK